MESWKNLILQWINCLHDDTNNSVKNIEELDDRLYYNLINKIKSLSQKHNPNPKEVVQHFIENEYPNIKFNYCKNVIETLYFAILVLSRLSLEPVFHKSLCINLPFDTQVKVKSILESVYTLGKDITLEDLCKILSISDKTNFKTSKKPKYVLEEFLNSPVIRSVHTDNKMHEQTRQLRNLRANIETLQYEKSELIEDLKIQQNQIKELQNKLQRSMSEMKSKNENNSNAKNINCTCQIQDVKLIQSTYEKEVQSLENYIAKLQNDNSQLQDEKNCLTNEIKMYKTNYYMLEEKNLNNQQTLESTLGQLEKKETELSELKVRYEELYNYLKEISNTNLYNKSYNLDDEQICETSLNKSETLSSVIEIQLKDTEKELIITKKKFNIVNTLLTMIMEEYIKLQEKMNILFRNNVKTNVAIYKFDEKQNEHKENILHNQYNLIEPESVHIKSINNGFDQWKNKILFMNSFQNNLTNANKMSLFLDLLNINDLYKGVKRLKNNINFNTKKVIGNNLLIYKNNSLETKKININPTDFNTVKTLQNYKYNLKVDRIDRYVLCKIYEMIEKKNWVNETHLLKNILYKILIIFKVTKEYNVFNKLFFSIINDLNTIDIDGFLKLLNLKIVIVNNCEINFESLDAREYILQGIYTLTQEKILYMIPHIIKLANNYTIKKDSISCLKFNEINNKCSKQSLLNQCSLKCLQSNWTFLFESICNNLKICKILLLLEKNWYFTFQVLKYIIDNYTHNKSKLKKLLKKKDLIDNELKNINFHNLQFLSIKLITTVQFVTMLNKDYYYELNLQEDIFISNSTLNDRIIIINKQINSFNNLLRRYKRKLVMNNESTIIYEAKNKNINETVEFIENKKMQNKTESNTFKNDNENHPYKLSKYDINYNQHSLNYLKNIHEKYEFKLERMKEKMKSVYNNQITLIKKEQEAITKSRIDALESKIKYQCYNHAEELEKYKKHIGELSKQLWHVGDKLINEKQEKENIIKKFQDIKTNYKSNEIQNKRFMNNELDLNYSLIKSEAGHNILQSVESDSINKIHNLRDFQIMGNAFSTEDEEGEVFDTTYISDMQKSRNLSSSHDLNRLSILQNRNAKCKPHLKSSYPAELQYHPTPFTEDEIKTGSTSEELFNNSLSQSLLTGKKVKWKDRTRNATDTPRRSRRFSNIFRKHRLSTEHK